MPSAPWPAALDAIDAAARAALADLDGYDARWREVEPDGVGPAVGGPTARGGVNKPFVTVGRPTESPDWDAYLTAVELLADAAGRDLTDRSAAVGRWRESLQRAVQLVEGTACPASP